MSVRISGRKLREGLQSLDQHPVFQKQSDVVGFGRCLAEKLPEEKISINDFLEIVERSIIPYVASVSQPSVQQCTFEETGCIAVDTMRFLMLERWLIDIAEYVGPKSLYSAVRSWYDFYSRARLEKLRSTPFRLLERCFN